MKVHSIVANANIYEVKHLSVLSYVSQYDPHSNKTCIDVCAEMHESQQNMQLSNVFTEWLFSFTSLSLHIV